MSQVCGVQPVAALLAMDRSGLAKLKDDPKRSVVYRAELNGRARSAVTRSAVGA